MLNFLKGRCTYELTLRRFDENLDINAERVFMTLMNSKCTLKHEHVNLTVFRLRHFTNEVLNIFQLFGHARASHLAVLNLANDKISSKEISKLCEVLDDQHLPELNELNVFGNPILDTGAGLLFDTLTTKGPRKLTKLNLAKCSLTYKFMRHVGDTLKLTYLSLGTNDLRDVGVRLLCDNFLTKEHCKLTHLSLRRCSITHGSISKLCEALREEHSELRTLDLSDNLITDEGACMLFEDALTKEHCKLNELNITTCFLTHLCIPTLSRTLQNKHCKLTKLRLTDNAIRDEGVCELFESALTNEHCVLTELSLTRCSLTDKCISSLYKTLRNERCVLKELNLRFNDFTDDGKLDMQKDAGVCKVSLLI